MSNLQEIFNCLESQQIKYNHNSLTNDSLLDSAFLKDMEMYKFQKDLSIWNIFFFIKNNLANKTYIEQDELLEKSMSIMLDEFNKETKKEYNKKEIIKSIKENTNNELTSKLFLSNYYKISLYIYYHDINCCIKFGNYEEKYLIVIVKNKSYLYFNDDNYKINDILDYNIIEYDEIKNYKKLKIDDLRDFCTRLNIDLYKNEKKKVKAILIENIKEKLELLI